MNSITSHRNRWRAPFAPITLRLATALLIGCLEFAPAAVLHVDLNSAAPTPPFSNWATAATNIQDAVDAADPGDLVLVTNGVYQTGGRAIIGSMTNRVAVDKPIILQSVNGPEHTVIQGYQIPGTLRGDEAIRSVYLGPGAQLAGFTITLGATRITGSAAEQNGGGIWCDSAAVVSNCVITSNAASSGGGLSCEATTLVSNCVISNNTATYGGGVSGGTLKHTFLTGNSASNHGGAAYMASLTDCMVTLNSALQGGGVYEGRLTNCTLRGNSARFGGGAAGDLNFGRVTTVLVACTLENNFAYKSLPNLQDGFGGGVRSARLIGCVLTGNSAVLGGGAYRADLIHCTIKTNRALDSGGGAYMGFGTNCAFTGNSAQLDGGGSYLSRLLNCKLNGNSASSGGAAAHAELSSCHLTDNSASAGGGAYNGTLTNCTFSGNSASSAGGGAAYASLYNCTLTGNSSPTGGGVFYSHLKNCISYFNTGGPSGTHNYDQYSTLNYSCTTPMPTNGLGNIATDPQFITTNAWANLRLKSSSPCINGGTNLFQPGSTDLDGRPRIQGGAEDIGAHEFQPGISGEFLGWLADSGLATEGSADLADADADGHNAWQEWQAGTNPTNTLSALRMLSPIATGPDLTLRWQSVPTRTYFLERSPALPSPPMFSLVQSNIAGLSGETTWTETNVLGSGPFFYRAGIQ